MKRIIKLLLVDDHQMVRTGIKLMLSQQNSFEPLVDEAVDGEEAIDRIQKGKYDVILLDINLPKKDGIAVIRFCNQKKITTPILAITMHKEEHVIKQVIDAGAYGYLIKNCGIEELTKAINTVLNFKKYYSNEVSQALLNKTPRKISEKSSSYLVNHLTQREKEIIGLIVNEYTTQEIALNLRVSKRTVDGHRASIIAKIQVKNTAGLVRFAIDNGLV